MKKQKAMMMSLAVAVGLVCFSNANAMRCDQTLVNEGATVAQVIGLCGQPTAMTGGNIVYINKDGDGMNYYLHTDANGIVDNVSFSRN